MEEVSKTEFARMSAAEKEVFLKAMFDDEDNYDSNELSDCEDEDWFPQSINNLSASDNDEAEVSGDTEKNVHDHTEAKQQKVESFSSEDEEDDETETAEPEISATDSFIAKDKTVWKEMAPYQYKVETHNGLRQRSGPHHSTETLSISDTFKKLFTENMVAIIVRDTNKKASSTYANYNADYPNSQLQWKPVTIPEIYSFFAVLICAGANNSNTDHTTDMWHSSSYPLYRATMRLNRFHNIMRFLRFDDNKTRSQRKKKDKAAPIRDLWTMLNSNLSKMYKPTVNLTIDEQLYPFRGRTSFTQYIPSKLAKHGIRIWWICDAENAYPLQGVIDTGKTNNDNEKNQGERVIKELAFSYRKSGRNICMDNFFTTLPVAKHLLSWNLTIVGTIKKNKPYIPSVMAAKKSRPLYSTVFGFHERVTMCSYVPKKNKSVILISTKHSDKAVSDDTKMKPDMLNYYNKYKAGVETVDQMLEKYTSQRRSIRWPVAMFFNMLDITVLSSYIIYYENNSMIKKKTTERRYFMRQLSEELARPMIESRLTNLQVMRNYTNKIAIECIIGRQSPRITEEPDPAVQRDTTGRIKVTGCCHMCNKLTMKRRRKTRKRCTECQLPICDEHSKSIVKCLECNK